MILALDGAPSKRRAASLQTPGRRNRSFPHHFFALRAIDEAGNAGPLATIGPLTLRRVSLTHGGAGRDRLSLTARITALLAQLGLPGQDVTLVLQNGTGQFFSVTVPAVALVPNATGTRVRFRDPTGTLAGGLTSLSMGGRTRTDVTVRGRHLSLAGAAAGPFTAILRIGSLELSATGMLRPAGSRLVFP